MRGAPPGRADDITLAALFGTLLLNAALVYYALLPLRELEATAVRVAGAIWKRACRPRASPTATWRASAAR